MASVLKCVLLQSFSHENEFDLQEENEWADETHCHMNALTRRFGLIQ